VQRLGTGMVVAQLTLVIAKAENSLSGFGSAATASVLGHGVAPQSWGRPSLNG